MVATYDGNLIVKAGVDWNKGQWWPHHPHRTGFSYQAIQSLVNKADVEDNRIRFY